MISSVFNVAFFEPLLNGLVFLINILPFHDVGFSIIILTIIVRFIIFPLNHRAIITQQKIKQLEPALQDIKEKFKKDSQEQAKKTMELYRQHGVNPFSGFITLLIQIPIIFALYKVFSAGVHFDPAHIYSFIQVPHEFNLNFLGLFDLTDKSYVLGFIVGATQFFQMQLAIPPIKKQNAGVKNSFKDDLARNMNIQMRYVMPVLIFFIVSRLSGGIAVYWTTMNTFAIIHEFIVRKKANKIIKKDNEDNGKTETNNKITD
jgi:YidC/Oxa1 family membrane protein insertase